MTLYSTKSKGYYVFRGYKITLHTGKVGYFDLIYPVKALACKIVGREVFLQRSTKSSETLLLGNIVYFQLFSEACLLLLFLTTKFVFVALVNLTILNP